MVAPGGQERHQDLCNGKTCSTNFSFYLVHWHFMHPERQLWHNSEADSAQQPALRCSATTWYSWRSWETSENTENLVSIVVGWEVENQLPIIIEMKLLQRHMPTTWNLSVFKCQPMAWQGLESQRGRGSITKVVAGSGPGVPDSPWWFLCDTIDKLS